MKFLVVDDSLTMRRIIKNSLQKLGFADVSEASTGLEALEEIGKGGINIVLTDWNMPEMDGIQVLRAMRRHGIDIPLGFVTSEGSAEMREQADAAGALFLIAKPFTAETFRDTIDPFLA